MPGPEDTTPKTKAQKYLEDAQAAEGTAARAAGYAAAWLVGHPHIALWGAFTWTMTMFVLGYLAGRP